jgi:hypothetical protein
MQSDTRVHDGEPIQAVADLTRQVKELAVVHRRLFRGQNTDQPLYPKIARLALKRGIPLSKVTDIEKRMLARFRRESRPMLTNLVNPSDWELLSIARHNGLPTRLLDWTANALAGLWFAVSSNVPKREDHAVLWMLDVDPENEKTLSPADDIFRMKRTYIFQPYHVDRRIVAQAAWFSLHRYAEKQDTFLPLDQHERYRRAMTKFVIPRDSVRGIRHELRVLGITQAMLFPDLSGLCADIQAECIDSWKPLNSI